MQALRWINNTKDSVLKYIKHEFTLNFRTSYTVTAQRLKTSGENNKINNKNKNNIIFIHKGKIKCD